MRIIGEFLAELGRRLVERAAAVERIVPAPEVHLLDEPQPLFILGNLAGQKGFGIPAVKDVTDVEDDGGDTLRHEAQEPVMPDLIRYPGTEESECTRERSCS